MPNLAAAGLTAPLQQPCHTPRVCDGHPCNCQHRAACPGTDTECSWHTCLPSQSFPFWPSSEASCPGGKGQSPSVPFHPCWAVHSQGNSTRGRWSQSVLARLHWACHRRNKHLFSSGGDLLWSPGSTHRVLPSLEVQRAALIKHREWKISIHYSLHS